MGTVEEQQQTAAKSSSNIQIRRGLNPWNKHTSDNGTRRVANMTAYFLDVVKNG